MRKQELVGRISEETGLSQKIVKLVVESFLEEIKKALERGEKVELRRFGVFQVRPRRGREMIHPRLRKKIKIPVRRYPFFKPSKTLKERVA